MKHFEFKAYAILNEIDLNKIAVDCGIRKNTLGGALILDHRLLGNTLYQEYGTESKVLIFSFGCIVLINTPEDIMPRLLSFIKSSSLRLICTTGAAIPDEYELRIEPEGTLEITDEYAVVPRYELFYMELAAIIIAKSVAMEKQNMNWENFRPARIDDRPARRGPAACRQQGACQRATAQVTRHQYNTISYIMILDKPDVTWSNSDASLYYEKMSEFFELNDRYTILTKKADIMNNIINGFSFISHSIRGLFVEWVIVLLIVFEVILMVLDLVL